MSGPLAQGEPVIPDFGEGSDCVVENRLFCPDWVRDNWAGVLQPALLEHVKLTLIAVAPWCQVLVESRRLARLTIEEAEEIGRAVTASLLTVSRKGHKHD